LKFNFAVKTNQDWGQSSMVFALTQRLTVAEAFVLGTLWHYQALIVAKRSAPGPAINSGIGI
jgi:hypothetical protein